MIDNNEAADMLWRAKQLRQEIAQILAYAENWNTYIRQEDDEQPINPDPDGDLA